MAAAKYTFALTRAALTMNTEKPKRRDCKERPRWSVAYTHWTTSMIMVEIVVRDVTTEEVKMKSQIKSSPFFHFFFRFFDFLFFVLLLKLWPLPTLRFMPALYSSPLTLHVSQLSLSPDVTSPWGMRIRSARLQESHR